MKGGSGFDTLDFSSASDALAMDISKGTATGFGADSFSGFERYVASALADVITGSNRAETIEAGAGDDLVRGLGGSDVLTGGAGSDTFVYLKKDLGGGAVDVVTDFTAEDHLDLRDMLKSFSADELSGALLVTDGSDGSLVSVRVGGAFTDVVMLQGVHGVDAATLLADGMLLA